MWRRSRVGLPGSARGRGLTARMPGKGGRAGRGDSRHVRAGLAIVQQAGCTRGRVKRKTEPSPSALSAQIRPPWASTKLSATARPRPVPLPKGVSPSPLERAESARQKRSKT